LTSPPYRAIQRYVPAVPAVKDADSWVASPETVAVEVAKEIEHAVSPGPKTDLLRRVRAGPARDLDHGVRRAAAGRAECEARRLIAGLADAGEVRDRHPRHRVDGTVRRGEVDRRGAGRSGRGAEDKPIGRQDRWISGVAQVPTAADEP
jgi:hypothetical protein